MENLKKNYIFYLIMLVAFYFIPFLIIDTGSGMFILLLVLPIICFLTSLAYGIKNAFNILYPLIVAIMFVPTIFIFFNTSAFIYVLIYGVLALLGNLTGYLFRKK